MKGLLSAVKVVVPVPETVTVPFLDTALIIGLPQRTDPDCAKTRFPVPAPNVIPFIISREPLPEASPATTTVPLEDALEAMSSPAATTVPPEPTARVALPEPPTVSWPLFLQNELVTVTSDADLAARAVTEEGVRSVPPPI